MNDKYVDIADLKVAEPLYQLVDEIILPGLEISSNQVWELLSQLVKDLGPRNQDHLDLRDDLQNQIDEFVSVRRATFWGHFKVKHKISNTFCYHSTRSEGRGQVTGI